MHGGAGAVGVAVGDADELVRNEVELFVYRADDALDGFLHSVDAGALLGTNCGDGGKRMVATCMHGTLISCAGVVTLLCLAHLKKTQKINACIRVDMKYD